VAVLAVLLGACADGRTPHTAGPNAILISIDSLRAEHVGCYGYDQPTSPRLDAFARDGVRFEHAYSTTSWTLPSHTSMLTGLYTDAHGVDSSKRKLKDSAVTLAEVLKQRGYLTGAIVCAPLLNRSFGLWQGFDSYDTKLVPKHGRPAHRARLGPDVNERALEWLDRQPNKPFFLFLHYWDVHFDYDPPKKYVELFDPDYQGKIDGRNIYYRNDIVPGMNPRDLQHLIALYDGEIRFEDDILTTLFDGLAERGLLNNTMVWITADHGEEFLEHGGRAHTCTVHEELIRVPLLAQVPWFTPAQKIVPDVVSLVDLFPTFLELLGVPRPPDLKLQGVSLAPAMQRGERLADRLIMAETVPGRFPTDRKKKFRWAAVIDSKRMKLHQLHVRRDDLRDLLYNLVTDPGELRDLAAEEEEAEAVARLRGLYGEAKDQNTALRKELSLDAMQKLDKQTEETLKGLGYVH
jgi:arylsulfatase A-like enzyme